MLIIDKEASVRLTSLLYILDGNKIVSTCAPGASLTVSVK